MLIPQLVLKLWNRLCIDNRGLPPGHIGSTFCWPHGKSRGAWGVELSAPQIKYTLGGSSKKGSHVCILLIVAMVLLLWHQIVLLWHQVTMVSSKQNLYQTIVLPIKVSIGSIHDYHFCCCPLVGILFEVLRINTTVITATI